MALPVEAHTCACWASGITIGYLLGWPHRADPGGVGFVVYIISGSASRLHLVSYTLYVLRCVGSRPRRVAVGAWDGDGGCGGLVRCVIVCVLCCVCP